MIENVKTFLKRFAMIRGAYVAIQAGRQILRNARFSCRTGSINLLLTRVGIQHATDRWYLFCSMPLSRGNRRKRRVSKLMADSDHKFQAGDYGAYAELVSRAQLAQDQARLIHSGTAPIRIFGAEICGNIGHMVHGFDLRFKLRDLGIIDPQTRYIVATSKVANLTYLGCWESHCDRVITLTETEARFLASRYWALHEHVSMISTRNGVLALPEAMRLVQEQWNTSDREPLLTLDRADSEAGTRYLKSQGMTESDWFVTLHVREGPEAYGRSAKLESYLPAIKAITDAGGHVIRLPNVGSSPLPAMPRVIDYGVSSERSEQLDIFLMARGRFMVATTSGPSCVPGTFGRPILWTNVPQIMAVLQVGGTGSLAIPKLALDVEKGHLVDLNTMVRNRWGWTDNYIPSSAKIHHPEKPLDEGFRWRDNTPDEITDGVIEMLTRTSANNLNAGLAQEPQVSESQRDLIDRVEHAGGLSNVHVSDGFINKHKGLLLGG